MTASQSEPRGVRVVTYRNDSGETIPAYALIQFTGTAEVNGQIVWTATKWDGGSTGDVFYFNGPSDVADGRTGFAIQPNTAQWVLYDDADTPAFQEEWGPVANSFEIGSGGSGFLVMSAPTSGRVLAVAKSGGSGVQVIRFEIDSVDCSICNATASVLSRPPGVSTVTGEDSYEQVTVYDFARCFLDAPEEDLIGRKGFAVYLDFGSVPGDCAVEPGITSGWLILSLCCVEDAC